MEKVELLNVHVNNLTMHEALSEIEKYIKQDTKSYVVAVNVDVIMKIEQDQYLRDITNYANMVLVDGKPLVWISKLYKRPIKEKISGSDLVPQLCRISAIQGYTIFILGGRDGVAQKAKKNLEKSYPGIIIVGCYSPPFGFERDRHEVEKINQLINQEKPDLLIVCFGCPKQEKYIYENINKYNAKVSICAGATVDFLAGNVKRAPKLVSDMGFEWLYRFTRDPKRLFKRYFIDDMKIIKLIRKYR